MDITQLSPRYGVRRLCKDDMKRIFDLCSSNPLFYQYHPPFVTEESILNDMEALPPHKGKEDKFYAGFFAQNDLVAVMDLILDYPREKTAFIGFFMMHQHYQGEGLGSDIIQDCASCLSAWGFSKIRLAIDKGNPQSEAFWTKNHFFKTGEEFLNGDLAYVPMERAL